ncbi:flavodoxin FldB [Alteromonas sp. a30]|uniref:flavodoxin FldB n=1 Tax=Alteromonas sp. a30 TaxID=2730917 RepID=UPI002282C0DF|nr:flavodoxin FldB [Alteromonas sp. a30]MCY7294300.1 flavodoxin FldB [Alteromonas sp. a30]
MPDNPSPIGLFYGSTTCYTEMAAEKIQEAINTKCGFERVSLHNIKDTNLANTENYSVIIFGISTWDFGELQEDWESQWDDVASLNLKDKIVAIFGLGDQVGYPDWFQDAVGMLHEHIQPQGCHSIGYWPNEGYEFTQSKALTEDGEFFVGLSLDDENQWQSSEERIDNWVEQILLEIQEIEKVL